MSRGAADRDWLSWLRNLPVLQPGDQVDAIICVRCDDDHPLLLLDNEIADCCRCGNRVQFRPTCPQGPKTCMECVLQMMEATP